MGFEDITQQREEGKLQMGGGSLQRRWKCMGQLGRTEGGCMVRGWVVGEEEEAGRIQQRRQHQRRNQVQQQEAAWEGLAGEPAGGEVP